MAPLVQVAYRESSPRSASLFNADRLRAITIHLQACVALRQLDDLLRDIPWVTFKGPIFSELAHPVPGIRSYTDVDVLVSATNLREVTNLLLVGGWRVADYRDMLRNPDVPGEMHWVSPGGALIDLHWSMINMASRRRLFDVSTDELLRRRLRVPLGPDAVWGLDPTDSIVHACLHAALAGANKLVYLVDVDGLSRTIVDWDEVADRALEWRAQAQMALVLARAQRVLDTPVPTDLGSRVRAPWLVRGLVPLTDRVAPVPRGRTNRGLSKFVARAVRPTGPATARALAGNAGRGLQSRIWGPPQLLDERLSADHASLEIYLQAVESVSARPVEAKRHSGSNSPGFGRAM